jgi:hypothetical protein
MWLQHRTSQTGPPFTGRTTRMIVYIWTAIAARHARSECRPAVALINGRKIRGFCLFSICGSRLQPVT